MNLEIEEISVNQIHTIKNLWLKLNDIHMHDSTYFKDHFHNFTFEERCQKFSYYKRNKLKIDVLKNNLHLVGYCISTIDGNTGELDSLFIESEFQKYGFGQKLVDRSISWLKHYGCVKIHVSVAEGHESVLEFYKRFGFYPRMTQLVLKDS